MAATSNDQHPDELENPSALPAIAAAFLVTFDNRKGYTLSWSRSLPDIKLEGVVEFKSLPSGLHNVQEDLVYFVYQDYAGISAFLRGEADEESRNARMLSVGVLVPRESGRMGKSWLHAQTLKLLASKLMEQSGNTALLEKYWEEHKASERDATSSPGTVDSPSGYHGLRTASTTSLAIPNPSLTPHHPALALPELVRTFGPLLFPLFRAALRQSRILILGEAPVELSCDFVYNISVLTSLSRSLASVVPIDDAAKLRLQPLFNVGITDIDLLSSLKTPWVACTTDDVLCSKPQLFDLLVVMPTPAAKDRGHNRTFPRLILSSPELARVYPHQGVRATQRDARRYQTLKSGLKDLPDIQRPIVESRRFDEDSSSTHSTVSTIPDKHEAVESVSWPLIAYNSLVWWASAGDRRSGLMEAEEQEHEQDAALLQQDPDVTHLTKEVALVAYFHRLSAIILQGLAKAVQRSSNPEPYHDDESDEEARANGNGEEQDRLLDRNQDDQESVEVEEEDVRSMGLDIWSESDRQFLIDMLHLWWGRTAVVRGGTVECCGLRIA